MYTAHRKSSHSLKDFQSKNTRLKTLKTVTCLAAHTRIHTYVHTYIHTYLHPTISKEAGFGHRQPRFVTYATWISLLWSLVALQQWRATAQNWNKSFTRHRGFGELNRPSPQSSPRSYFRYDSHYIKVWHSINPTGNALLSRTAGRCFAPLQAEFVPKLPFSCVNRSLIWCVFLRVPAKELTVWTYESGNDACSWMLNFLTR